jgi:hypothetical protein
MFDCLSQSFDGEDENLPLTTFFVSFNTGLPSVSSLAEDRNDAAISRLLTRSTKPLEI